MIMLVLQVFNFLINIFNFAINAFNVILQFINFFINTFNFFINTVNFPINAFNVLVNTFNRILKFIKIHQKPNSQDAAYGATRKGTTYEYWHRFVPSQLTMAILILLKTHMKQQQRTSHRSDNQRSFEKGRKRAHS